MFLSHHSGQVRRLVVFIHGFMGKTVTTWLDFPRIDASHPENIWWLESDLLFVGYRSTRDDITGVANRIRQNLDHFYPQPPLDVLTAGGVAARADIASPYEELILVGHSLGGLILRRALCDAAQKWIDNKRAPDLRPILLDAQNRMFSPASAGFRAAGLLGVARAVPIWSAVEMFLRRASAYTDLQPDSTVLREIQRRTIKMEPDKDDDLSALRANIVWASPDNVVIADRYITDFVESSWDGTTHSSLCKPSANGFEMPWTFVRTGNPL
jgi:pimeloyl-ACP methyl ester carboxylesterase